MKKDGSCACGKPVALYCHVCHSPVCWDCNCTYLLIPHCKECWAKEHNNTGTLPEKEKVDEIRERPEKPKRT